MCGAQAPSTPAARGRFHLHCVRKTDVRRTVMNSVRYVLAVVVLAVGGGLVAFANETGPAERAGKAIDRGAEKVGKAAKKAAEKVGEGVEKAGKAIERAGRKTGEAVGKAVEKTGEALQRAGEKVQGAAAAEKK
jgi:hypothetical protein